jgi:hypothetical protein
MFRQAVVVATGVVMATGLGLAAPGAASVAAPTLKTLNGLT